MKDIILSFFKSTFIGLFIAGIILFLIFGLMSRCTYTSYCKYCGKEFRTDLLQPTQPNIDNGKYCKQCGKPINIGVYNNFEYTIGHENKILNK